MGGSQEPRSSPGVTGPGVSPDTCPSLSWPPDIVSVQGFNYQIRSGVAHTLHTARQWYVWKLKTNIIWNVIHNFLYNTAYFSVGSQNWPGISCNKRAEASITARHQLGCFVFFSSIARLYISLSFQAGERVICTRLQITEAAQSVLPSLGRLRSEKKRAWSGLKWPSGPDSEPGGKAKLRFLFIH